MYPSTTTRLSHAWQLLCVATLGNFGHELPEKPLLALVEIAAVVTELGQWPELDRRVLYDDSFELRAEARLRMSATQERMVSVLSFSILLICSSSPPSRP